MRCSSVYKITLVWHPSAVGERFWQCFVIFSNGWGHFKLDLANLWKIAKKSRITLLEKSHCECERAVSCETGSSSMLNEIANCAYKVRADWLNNIYSPRESKGFKVESQNDKLCLTWNLIWARSGAVIIADKETIKFMRTRASEAILKWNLNGLPVISG